MLNGQFLEMTCDKAMLLPMVEMCGGRFSRIKDVLYIYNCVNPIRDCAVDGKKQWNIAHYLYDKAPYEPLKEIIVRNETLLEQELVIS